MADAHLLGVCIWMLCPGGAVFGTGHLNGSWFLTAQGYMLDWLGDVTFTASFCQLSGGVCYLTNVYAWIACLVWAHIRPTMCAKYAFCIVSVNDVCPHILSLFHV